MLLLAVTVSVANVFLAFGVFCMPISDQDPNIDHSWGQSVRLKHLYAARSGLHLLIGEDGQIHGSAHQTPYSLLEISPVDTGCVVIRGVAAARFLCIEGDGRLYSSHTYSRDDCTFREQILPDGYNVYVSEGHGALLSLGNYRQRLQGRDRAFRLWPSSSQEPAPWIRLRPLDWRYLTSRDRAQHKQKSLWTQWTRSESSLRSFTVPASTRDETGEAGDTSKRMYHEVSHLISGLKNVLSSLHVVEPGTD